MADPSPPPPKRPARRLARLGYALVRPILRPLAWRLRGFLTGEIMAELANARIRQETALQRLDDLVQRSASPAFGPGAPASLDPGIASAMERLLLTLALEDAARPNPPGLSNPPIPG